MGDFQDTTNSTRLWEDAQITGSPDSQFVLATADRLVITDAEISALLAEVYVEAGFVTPEEAETVFEPAALRGRGILIGARECRDSAFAGMVIVVPKDSDARRLAVGDAAELHLLGVRSEYRRLGLGRMLVEAALETAGRMGSDKMILWTQTAMIAAQRLYESMGFNYTGDMQRNARVFRVYERVIDVS